MACTERLVKATVLQSINVLQKSVHVLIEQAELPITDINHETPIEGRHWDDEKFKIQNDISL